MVWLAEEYPPINYNVYKEKSKNQDAELQLNCILSHLLMEKCTEKRLERYVSKCQQKLGDPCPLHWRSHYSEKPMHHNEE